MLRPWPDRLVAAGFCLCVFCDVWLARASPPTSDLIQSALEISSIRAGNILLHHWILGVDNFYFTDLPPFVALSALFGVHPWLIWFEPAVVYALLLFAALRLVRRARPPGVPAWPGQAMVLLLIGVPFGVADQSLLHADEHTATIALSLYALLLVQPALQALPFSRWRLLPFGLLMFALVASDPQAAAFCCAPLVVLVILRFWLHPRWAWDDALVAFATLIGAGAGAFWPHFIAHNQGFTTNQNFLTTFVADPRTLLKNAGAVACALRALFSARTDGITGVPAAILAATRFTTLLLAAMFCVRVVWRAPRALREGSAQVLILGLVCLGAADAVSQTFTVAITPGPDYPNAAVRYVTPGFILMAIAAAMSAQDFCAGQRWRWRAGVLTGAVVAVIFGLCACEVTALAMQARAGIRAAPQYALANWLIARHLTYGVGDYWTAQMVTGLSSGKVVVDAVTAVNGLSPFALVLNRTRFDSGQAPQFVVFAPGNVFGVARGSVVAAYGRPAQVDQAGKYTVMILPPREER